MSAGRTILHTEASLGWGGQEIRIFTEMAAMRARGHRLMLAAPRTSNLHQRAIEAGFAVRHLDDRKWTYPLSILRIRQWIRQNGVTVVNPHSSRDGWIAGLAGRLAKTQLIVRSRHIEVDYPNRRTSRIAFAHLPHHVLTTSDRISARLIAELGLAPNRVTCVPTGIDLKRFHPAVLGVVHRDLGLNPEVPLVGMISVLRSWKGHEYFLRAALEIGKQQPAVRFIIAGEGPMRDAIATRIQELGLGGRVHLLGHRTDVPAVLASLAVLVLPSIAHEGIPQIVLQAQAMARAVVGTRIGGIPEVIRPGVTGLLIPPRDPEALTDALLGLLADPDHRGTLGQQAAIVAAQEYGLEVMCLRLEAVYDRHLGKPVTGGSR